MTESEKAELVEIATKRLAQYRKMNEHKNSNVMPRGGIEFQYEPSIALILEHSNVTLECSAVYR
ncbi:hypothetical protein PMPD1_2518 [Paramixta manurensis]|uniref:Uncharacterized protein n=1 Tax=Paramixta manurensis TaxID=2740817 RepID=A0A6M8UI86_9GAMM|nr:hypothetical protein PMPD1_2518 [Erwiniaceae bacterium PD-1]